MASEYDALLDAQPTQQKSEYDALLTPIPPTPAPEQQATQPSRIPSAYIPPDVEQQVTQKFDVQHPILGAAAQALGETVSGFVPRTVQQVEQFATPAAGAFEDIGKAAGSLTDALFGGQTLTQAAAGNYPESLALKEAEQTAPFSKERFKTGFDVVAQMLMGGGIAHGIPARPTLTESIFGKEAAPEATPLTPETPITDAAAGVQDRQLLVQPERRFTLVPEPPPEIAPVQPLEQQVSELPAQRVIQTPEGEVPVFERGAGRTGIKAEIARVGGEPSATQERQIAEGNIAEHPGNVEGGTPAETGGGGGAQPSTPIPAPQTITLGEGAKVSDAITAITKAVEPWQAHSAATDAALTNLRVALRRYGDKPLDAKSVENINGAISDLPRYLTGDASAVPPLRQQGETAAARQETQPTTPQEVAPAVPQPEQPVVSEGGAGTKPPVQIAPESGISNERLQTLYGKDAVVSGGGRSTEELQRIGQKDTRDPYQVLSQAQQRGIATPEDTMNLRNEHQRLLAKARDAYGTPEYNDLAQQAVDFANATKGVAHTPASDIMRGLQGTDKPNYTSPADFDNIVRERMNRESTPTEKEVFQKTADEVKNGEQESSKSAQDAQDRLKTYKPNEKISFDEAVDHVRKQIAQLTKDCLT